MYQAQDYHTMTGCVCMNLSWSIEWAILNRISLLLQSQTLSGLWTACLFTYGSEPLRICGMIFNNGCLLHFPPATQIQPKCFAPMKGIIFLKWHIKKKKKKKVFAVADELHKTHSKVPSLPRDGSCPENKAVCTETLARQSGARTVNCFFLFWGKRYLNVILPKRWPLWLRLTLSEGPTTTIFSLLMPYSSSYHQFFIMNKQIFFWFNIED